MAQLPEGSDGQEYKGQILGVDDTDFIRAIKTDASGAVQVTTGTNSGFSLSDKSGNDVFATTFGQLATSQKDSQITEQFAYGLPSTGIITDSTGTGEIATENSLLKIRNTGTGDGTAYIESLQAVRYIPGSMAYAFFTVTGFPFGVANANAWAGLYDDEDGFAIGMKSGVPTILRRRYNGSIAVDEEIGLSSFDDKLDGTGSSQYTIDWTKGNIFAIMFGYLGFAPIQFLVKADDGRWIEFHKIKYPNKNVDTHISMPYLPLRFEIDNTGSGEVVEIGAGSVDAGIFNGGKTDSTFRYTVATGFNIGNTPVSTTTDNYFIAVRGKDVVGGRRNKISSLLNDVSIATEGSTKTITVDVLKNPTETAAGTWASLGDASPLEYSVNTTYDLSTGIETGAASVVYKDDAFVFGGIDDISILVRRGEVLVFKFSSTNGTVSDYTIGFKDLY